jgi:hypothetical protein
VNFKWYHQTYLLVIVPPVLTLCNDNLGIQKSVTTSVSTALAVFVAGGGIQSTYAATMTLAASALVAGINAGLYTVYITFFKKG